MTTAPRGPDALAGSRLESLPSLFRWVLVAPRPAIALGFAAAAANVALGFAVTGTGNSLYVMGHGVYAIYWVWLPLALRSLVRGSARDAAALAPIIEKDAGETGGLGERVLRAARDALPAGAALGFAVALFDLWVILGGPAPPDATSVVAYVVVRELVICLAVFAVLGWGVGAARALALAARDHARVDLLDPGALMPLVRCGTRLALWWVVMNAITLVFLVSPDLGGTLAMEIVAYTLGFEILAVAVLLVPTWGAHQAIARAKASELARVRGQLRAARETGDDGRVPGLLAWEQRVADVTEWPIGAGAVLRMGLYALIPVASWIAGALVERAVDALLG